jgi:hypothetical protein
VSSATGLDFWIATAAACLGCHATGVLRTGESLGLGAATWLRRTGLAAANEATAEPEWAVDGEKW